MKTKENTLFKEGARHGHFIVKRVVPISEIDVMLVELIHEKTGAEVMHLAANDDENLFNLSFRTYPDSSNGVAHILEHTVLCGSEKYPVKDPFFSMNRRSLNTFMNAFTGSDFTCYPASTQVKKDFYNLLGVYLDAVFNPKLSELSFLQEGHRLEFNEAQNPKSELTIKGIVYNEMKGAMASPDARMSEALMEALMPDLTYGINSGGNPKVIPELTYEQLKSFHKKYYHPSRCLFFFYGNLELKEHLDFLEKEVLHNVEKFPPLAKLPLQKRFKEKIYKSMDYPYSQNEDLEDKTMVALSWLTTTILNQEEVLALNVIDLSLMGTDAAPLKMALLKSQLCKQVDSSLEDEISEVPFTLVCKGCSKDSLKSIEKLTFETLQKVVEEGLPEHLIEGAIHQLEFSRMEISVPFGLSLYFRAALLKQHGGKPEDGLKIHTLFKTLREKVKDPAYLKGLIQKYFLKNTHFVALEMHPNPQLQVKESTDEKEMLLKIKETLSEDDIKKIVVDAKALAALQEKEENANLDVLPKVTIKDVSLTGKELELKQEPFEHLTLFYHPCFTNEIIYTALAFDLPKIKEEDLPYLRLFTHLLPQMGCGGRNYKETLDFLFQHTGGIGVDLDLSLQAPNPNKMAPCLLIKGKALYRKADKLFSLLTDYATSVNFNDPERLQELLKQHYEELENSVQNSPLRYAMNLAASSYSLAGHIHNVWYGLDYYLKIKEILAQVEKDPSQLIQKLKFVQESCLCLESPHLILGCDEKMYADLKKASFYGLSKIPLKKFNPWQADYPLTPKPSQGRLISAPVAFTTELFKAVPYVDEMSPVLSVASKIMENRTLHKRIREQGGAYGSGSTNVPMSGLFYFFSYRDPHLKKTLKAFEEAVTDLSKEKFEARDLEEAKLEIIQDLDAPLAPESRAFVAYSRMRSGRTPKLRNEFRKRLFECDEKAVKKAALDILKPGMKDSVCVTFGNRELLEKENHLLKEKALPLYPV